MSSFGQLYPRPYDLQMQDDSIQECGPKLLTAVISTEHPEDILLETSLKTELKSEWTLWMDKSTRGESAAEFESSVKKVCTMKTYEEFWNMYNTIPEVSELCYDHSYHLIKGSRRPIWEDECNCRGGAWKFRCAKSDSAEVWKKLMIAAVEGHFMDCCQPGDMIAGMSMTVRENEDTAQVWNVNAALAPRAKIIRKVRQLLCDINFKGVFYKAFAEHLGFARRDNVTMTIPYINELEMTDLMGDKKSPEDSIESCLDDVVSAPFEMTHRQLLPKWLLPSSQHPLNNPMLPMNKHPLGRRHVQRYNLFPPFMSIRTDKGVTAGVGNQPAEQHWSNGPGYPCEMTA